MSTANQQLELKEKEDIVQNKIVDNEAPAESRKKSQFFQPGQ